MTEPTRPLPRRQARIRRWLRKHDDQWGFTLVYITLAVVLSMAISLFWLVAVVAAHAMLEYWSLGRQGVHRHRLGWVVWHVKLDIALVLFALWLGLYIEVLFGIAGLSAAARATAQTGARFLAWQRAVRGVLLTLDDAAVVAKSVMGRNGSDTPPANRRRIPPWRCRWGVGDHISIAMGVLFAVLILLAPVLTDHDPVSALQVMATDLHPWPG